MASLDFKPEADIEIQVQEVDASKELSQESNALIDSWDAPDNKENPRNWSPCECHPSAC